MVAHVLDGFMHVDDIVTTLCTAFQIPKTGVYIGCKCLKFILISKACPNEMHVILDGRDLKSVGRSEQNNTSKYSLSQLWNVYLSRYQCVEGVTAWSGSVSLTLFLGFRLVEMVISHRHGHLGTGRPSAAVAIPRASLWCPDFRSAYLDLGSVGIQYRVVGHRPDATAITALLKGKQSIGIRGQSRQMYLTVFHRLAKRFIPALKSANSGTVSGQCLFVSFGSAARARISNSVSGAVSSHSSHHSREVLMA